MTETDNPPPHTNGISDDGLDDEDRTKIRPADIDADVREMERRKRVEMIMNSRLFREELERIIEIQMKDGSGGATLLQSISDMMGLQGQRMQSTNLFRSSNCVAPINDIRGVESMGYAKGEKILRCKVAAVYRLMDLYGWTQNIQNHITARLNVDEEIFLVNPHGLLYNEVTASSLVKVDMRGDVLEAGTTNFGVNIATFSMHAAIHAARPDLKAIVHVHTPAVVAVSSLKAGLLPLSRESVVLGEISTHPFTGYSRGDEEKEKIVRNLGPNNKVLFLSNNGAVCCGETVEEAFYNVYNLVAACEAQLKLMPAGLDNLVLIPEDVRKEIYDSSRTCPEGAIAASGPSPACLEKKDKKWRIGGMEFEALMRMLDNAGFRTGYIYRTPLIKGDPPRPRNDVEVPPAVSSLGYLLEEGEMYGHNWKGRKSNDRTRWLNSPNVYQKVEILETGTTDPKKITKWVAEGSPTHSSTPVKIDGALQFVPKNTNPKEFKKLQQQIKDNRRADKITSGPQSQLLEGVSWDEAKKLQDANMSATGDQVILVGAASKGIIQRGFQHNATVYKTPYAKNPFDQMTDAEIEEYKSTVSRKQRGDTSYDDSESEALSSSAAAGLPPRGKPPVSETDDESRDEPRVLRINNKQVPKASQPEVVLSDDHVGSGPLDLVRRSQSLSYRSTPSMYNSPCSMSVQSSSSLFYNPKTPPNMKSNSNPLSNADNVASKLVRVKWATLPELQKVVLVSLNKDGESDGHSSSAKNQLDTERQEVNVKHSQLIIRRRNSDIMKKKYHFMIGNKPVNSVTKRKSSSGPRDQNMKTILSNLLILFQDIKYSQSLRFPRPSVEGYPPPCQFVAHPNQCLYAEQQLLDTNAHKESAKQRESAHSHSMKPEINEQDRKREVKSSAQDMKSEVKDGVEAEFIEKITKGTQTHDKPFAKSTVNSCQLLTLDSPYKRIFENVLSEMNTKHTKPNDKNTRESVAHVQKMESHVKPLDDGVDKLVLVNEKGDGHHHSSKSPPLIPEPPTMALLNLSSKSKEVLMKTVTRKLDFSSPSSNDTRVLSYSGETNGIPPQSLKTMPTQSLSSAISPDTSGTLQESHSSAKPENPLVNELKMKISSPNKGLKKSCLKLAPEIKHYLESKHFTSNEEMGTGMERKESMNWTSREDLPTKYFSSHEEEMCTSFNFSSPVQEEAGSIDRFYESSPPSGNRFSDPLIISISPEPDPRLSPGPGGDRRLSHNMNYPLPPAYLSPIYELSAEESTGISEHFVRKIDKYSFSHVHSSGSIDDISSSVECTQQGISNETNPLDQRFSMKSNENSTSEQRHSVESNETLIKPESVANTSLTTELKNKLSLPNKGLKNVSPLKDITDDSLKNSTTTTIQPSPKVSMTPSLQSFLVLEAEIEKQYGVVGKTEEHVVTKSTGQSEYQELRTNTNYLPLQPMGDLTQDYHGNVPKPGSQLPDSIRTADDVNNKSHHDKLEKVLIERAEQNKSRVEEDKRRRLGEQYVGCKRSVDRRGKPSNTSQTFQEPSVQPPRPSLYADKCPSFINIGPLQSSKSRNIKDRLKDRKVESTPKNSVTARLKVSRTCETPKNKNESKDKTKPSHSLTRLPSSVPNKSPKASPSQGKLSKGRVDNVLKTQANTSSPRNVKPYTRRTLFDIYKDTGKKFERQCCKKTDTEISKIPRSQRNTRTTGSQQQNNVKVVEELKVKPEERKEKGSKKKLMVEAEPLKLGPVIDPDQELIFSDHFVTNDQEDDTFPCEDSTSSLVDSLEEPHNVNTQDNNKNETITKCVTLDDTDGFDVGECSGFVKILGDNSTNDDVDQLDDVPEIVAQDSSASLEVDLHNLNINLLGEDDANISSDVDQFNDGSNDLVHNQFNEVPDTVAQYGCANLGMHLYNLNTNLLGEDPTSDGEDKDNDAASFVINDCSSMENYFNNFNLPGEDSTNDANSPYDDAQINVVPAIIAQKNVRSLEINLHNLNDNLLGDDASNNDDDQFLTLEATGFPLNDERGNSSEESLYNMEANDMVTLDITGFTLNDEIGNDGNRSPNDEEAETLVTIDVTGFSVNDVVEYDNKQCLNEEETPEIETGVFITIDGTSLSESDGMINWTNQSPREEESFDAKNGLRMSKARHVREEKTEENFTFSSLEESKKISSCKAMAIGKSSETPTDFEIEKEENALEAETTGEDNGQNVDVREKDDENVDTSDLEQKTTKDDPKRIVNILEKEFESMNKPNLEQNETETDHEKSLDFPEEDDSELFERDDGDDSPLEYENLVMPKTLEGEDQWNSTDRMGNESSTVDDEFSATDLNEDGGKSSCSFYTCHEESSVLSSPYQLCFLNRQGEPIRVKELDPDNAIKQDLISTEGQVNTEKEFDEVLPNDNESKMDLRQTHHPSEVIHSTQMDRSTNTELRFSNDNLSCVHGDNLSSFHGTDVSSIHGDTDFYSASSSGYKDSIELRGDKENETRQHDSNDTDNYDSDNAKDKDKDVKDETDVANNQVCCKAKIEQDRNRMKIDWDDESCMKDHGEVIETEDDRTNGLGIEDKGNSWLGLEDDGISDERDNILGIYDRTFGDDSLSPVKYDNYGNGDGPNNASYVTSEESNNRSRHLEHRWSEHEASSGTYEFDDFDLTYNRSCSLFDEVVKNKLSPSLGDVIRRMSISIDNLDTMASIEFENEACDREFCRIESQNLYQNLYYLKKLNISMDSVPIPLQRMSGIGTPPRMRRETF
uniref:Protein hu-li tai shao n=1 Tax=Cacopsylla melanoneura TaxID=428564 RepID=A0A8D9BH83_9HEMI